MSILPDNILIQQYLSGNNEAFETLLNRYKQRIQTADTSNRYKQQIQTAGTKKG